MPFALDPLSAAGAAEIVGLDMPRILAVRSRDTFKGDDWLG
jgi:hypothetical protein